MDKQMIEEMEKTLYDYRFHYDDCIEGSEPNLAKFLVNRGWIKPAENAVVLTREEYKSLTNELDKGDYGEFESGYALARKETAREILKDLFEEAIRTGSTSMEVLVMEYAKQYGVEIEEEV